MTMVIACVFIDVAGDVTCGGVGVVVVVAAVVVGVGVGVVGVVVVRICVVIVGVSGCVICCGVRCNNV